MNTMLTEANVEFSQPWHDKLTYADDERYSNILMQVGSLIFIPA